MERGFLSRKEGRGGRGVKENDTGLGNDTATNVSNDAANYTVNVESSIIDKSMTKNSGSNDVNTPIVNLEKPLEPNMGAHINDTANVKVSATSNSTPITSASMPESILFMTREKFANRANGFFLGKRIAYPLVTNYVGTTRSKYRLVKSMLNSSNGLFFFQSSSKDGLDAMLVNGPLFIRNNPFILIKWNRDVKLQKKDVGNVLVWVKFYGVP
ncbi:hypothetical protein Tco_0178893 [Tanacetum coccineum]